MSFWSREKNAASSSSGPLNISDGADVKGTFFDVQESINHVLDIDDVLLFDYNLDQSDVTLIFNAWPKSRANARVCLEIWIPLTNGSILKYPNFVIYFFFFDAFYNLRYMGYSIFVSNAIGYAIKIKQKTERYICLVKKYDQ